MLRTEIPLQITVAKWHQREKDTTSYIISGHLAVQNELRRGSVPLSYLGWTFLNFFQIQFSPVISEHCISVQGRIDYIPRFWNLSQVHDVYYQLNDSKHFLWPSQRLNLVRKRQKTVNFGWNDDEQRKLLEKSDSRKTHLRMLIIVTWWIQSRDCGINGSRGGAWGKSCPPLN